MKRKKITKWIPLLLFVLLFGIVDFLLKGYCIENAWNIGRRKTTLYDRYGITSIPRTGTSSFIHASKKRSSASRFFRRKTLTSSFH